MNSPFGHVRLATESDSSDLDRMMHEQYVSADDFEVHDPTWLMHDMSSVVLVSVLASGEIVSAMQGKIVNASCEIESEIQCKIAKFSLKSPAMIVSRAVTHARYRRRGLSALLYYHLVSFAIEQGCAMAISTIYDSGPWVSHMERTGFSLLPPSQQWHSHVTNKRPVLVAILQENQLNRYVRTESLNLQDNLHAFPWKGVRPSLTMDTGK